jgi:hypothetical protein
VETALTSDASFHVTADIKHRVRTRPPLPLSLPLCLTGRRARSWRTR